MKSTDRFKGVIESELIRMGQRDPFFAEKLQNPVKSVDKCIAYILRTVHKSGCNGFTDDEVYGMAAHYYDEAEIEVNGRFPDANVVVNHHVELTHEEIQDAKEAAKKELMRREQERLSKPKLMAVKKPEPATVQQTSLF